MASRHLSADFQNRSGDVSRPSSVQLDQLQVRQRSHQRPLSEQNPATYISPEAQEIDKWFEDLSYYEKTLEEMSITTLDDTFKDELSAIENWFRVLSDPERTACLYSLLKGTTPLQIKFFITVLTQMAAKDASLDPLSVIRSSSSARPSSVVSNQTEDISRLFARPNSQRLSSHSEYANSRRLSTENRPSVLINSSSQDDFSDDTVSPVVHQRMPAQREDLLGTNSQDWISASRSPRSPATEYLDVPKSIGKISSSVGTRSAFNHGSPPSPIGSPNGIQNREKSPRRSPAIASAVEPSSYRSRVIPRPRNNEEDEWDAQGATLSRGSAPKPPISDAINLNEIQDIPTWFRSLRLHKYTTIFEKDDWRTIIKMTEEDLMARGVAALGARRKMLKVFDSVKAELEARNMPY